MFSTMASCNGLVRRMVNLPRTIVGGFSRVLMGHNHNGGRRRDRNNNLPLHFQFQDPLLTPEESGFLSIFEPQFGTKHPFFYSCRFMEALKIAEDEHKLMFMYLHSPNHPFTPSFCRETLSSDLVVQFLDANFVCWGAVADTEEGLQMTATLQPATFPFCAVVAPAAGNSLAVLQQMEGPISPAELVEILQRTMEEQGEAFGNGRAKARAKEEEKIKADRRLREEQDAAYAAALKIDKEKENLKKPVIQYEKPKQNASHKQYNGKGKECATNDPQEVTKILIRFPNGERREQSFLCSDKIQSIYKYIDSLGVAGVFNYRLVSSFPRRVYGFEQLGMTLKEAGLHPKGTLFLELL